MIKLNNTGHSKILIERFFRDRITSNEVLKGMLEDIGINVEYVDEVRYFKYLNKYLKEVIIDEDNNKLTIKVYKKYDYETLIKFHNAWIYSAVIAEHEGYNVKNRIMFTEIDQRNLDVTNGVLSLSVQPSMDKFYNEYDDVEKDENGAPYYTFEYSGNCISNDRVKLICIKLLLDKPGEYLVSLFDLADDDDGE